MTAEQRRQSLIAAGEALRTWVRTQQAGWHAATSPAAVLHAAAGEAVTLPAILSDADAATPEERGDVSPVPRPATIGPAVAKAGRGLWVAVRALGNAGAAAAGHWRIGAAAAALVALAYGGVSYGPKAFAVVRTQLAAAGKHVTVFDTPRPAEKEEKAEPRAGARASQKRTGRLQIDSNPTGAHIVLDGQDRGIAPLVIGELAAGTHTIVLKSEDGSVERTVVVAAGKTTQVNEAIYSGWVHVSSPIELEISEGARSIRLDDSNQVLLPPGPHDIRFENRAYRFVDTKTVTVLPGDTVLLNVQPPRSRLTITASTPAEVLVDGTLVGGTPLTDFPLDVGTREIVVRNAAGAERRSTVTVTVEPVSMVVDFSN